MMIFENDTILSEPSGLMYLGGDFTCYIRMMTGNVDDLVSALRYIA